MNQQIKKAALWMASIIGFIALVYVAIFTISVIPAIILSPIFIYEIMKEGGWSEVPLYYKLVIICGGLIFAGIVVKELWSFVE
jgi:hypothetical protein